MKGRSRAVEKRLPSRSMQFAIAAGVVSLIWIVFGQTLGHDFVSYDDKLYVYGDPIVSAGLSGQGVAWAFVDRHTNNWHPLTLISHMLDCQVFGLNPGGHHFTNVLLHSIAAILLFVWLQNATGRLWSSAFVTALFAIHPLRVESVAWIAERKDVLSAVFFVLTLIAYTRYARAPGIGRYVTMSILFSCGLMSKPMLVTTPAVLLLLDYWPLGRLRDTKSFRRLISEKIPLFALSTGASLVALSLQVNAPKSVDQLPFLWRLNNAIVSYVNYIWEIFWPVNLAVFYPHPDNRIPIWQVLLAAALLIAISWAVFRLRRARPYLLVGWLWYLIMLLPVIGVIEVGLQGHADRYTYLPHVGLYIALTWFVVDLSASIARRREILGVCGGAMIVALSCLSWKQTGYWRNSETLWSHALAVTKDNDVALTDLGAVYMYTKPPQMDKALFYFEKALAVRSSSEHSHYSMSLALIHNSLGHALARKNRMDEAIEHLREAVRVRPDYPDGHFNLATALFQHGDLDEAIREWRTTLSIRPQDASAHTSFANALVQKGLLREAADHYKTAIQIDPDSVLALNNLAWLMAAGPDDSLRNNEMAVNFALAANQLSNGTKIVFIRTLAAAYAQAGDFEKALQVARRAMDQANAQGERDLANEIAHDVDLYQQRMPLRDPTLRNAQ